MHVKTRRVARGGLFLALTVLAIRLGSVIEMNTLFLLVLASYFVGIMQEEYKESSALALLAGGVVLGLFLTPEPFYVLTYGCMGGYLLLTEGIRARLSGRETAGNIHPHPDGRMDEPMGQAVVRRNQLILWGVRYLCYETMLAAAFLFFRQLIFPGLQTGWPVWLAVAAAQAGPVVYEAGYRAFVLFYRKRFGKI